MSITDLEDFVIFNEKSLSLWDINAHTILKANCKLKIFSKYLSNFQKNMRRNNFFLLHTFLDYVKKSISTMYQQSCRTKLNALDTPILRMWSFD